MKRLSLGLALSSLCVAGCSTVQPLTQHIRIACSEADAVLEVNGNKYTGLADLDLVRNKDVSITCTKPGFQTASKTVRTSLSGTGIADAIGGVLLLGPAVGLVTPGAWNLDETDVTLRMYKQ